MLQAIKMKIQQENLLDALNYGEINDEYELQSKALDIEISNQLRIYRKNSRYSIGILGMYFYTRKINIIVAEIFS